MVHGSHVRFHRQTHLPKRGGRRSKKLKKGGWMIGNLIYTALTVVVIVVVLRFMGVL
jgi:hypothetical protein